MKNISPEEFDIESEFESKVKDFLQIINTKSVQNKIQDNDTSFEEQEYFNIKSEINNFFKNSIVNYLSEWAQPEKILPLLFHNFILFFIKDASKEIKEVLTFDEIYNIFNSAVNQLRITFPEILIKVGPNLKISTETFEEITRGLNQDYLKTNWINIPFWNNMLNNLDDNKKLREMILFVEYILFQKKEKIKLE